jgi:hypothetical protein
MNEDKLPKHIHRHRKTAAFRVPECYKNNPRSLNSRANAEDAKRMREDEEFLLWYEEELKKHNPTKKQLKLLDQEKRNSNRKKAK